MNVMNVMNDDTPLHWSFDYNYGAQTPQFSQELISTLREYPARSAHTAAAPLTHVYNVLPNYWRGYQGGQHTETLRIGTASIQRSKDIHDRWHYAITYENTTSGEHLDLQFRCKDGNYRTLSDTWQVEARNAAGDAYRRLLCEGYLTPESEVRLRINNTDIAAGRAEDSGTLTCNWALFDVIPALADAVQASGEKISLSVLEDLEHLRPNSRLGYLESIETPIPLHGYYLYGTGLLPSYWWLDVHGNVAIASTFFETLVLKETFGGSQ